MAKQFTAAGHDVTVVTETPGPAQELGGVAVVRQPGTLKLYRMCRRSDVVMSANVSLRAAPAMLMSGTPLFFAHGGRYFTDRYVGFLKRLKLFVCSLGNNIYCSNDVAGYIGLHGTVIPNTFRSNYFKEYPGTARSADLICFGRLVSDKGFSTAIEALQLLAQEGEYRLLTIVGDGPEAAALQSLAQNRGVGHQVVFSGALTDETLARIICKHKIAVFPSLVEEGFGNVALEALGCGCITIVSDGGGLPEAGGKCAIVFKRGCARSLADAILKAREIDTSDPAYEAERKRHLDRHAPEFVAARYLDEFQRVLQKRRPSIEIAQWN